MGDKPKSIGRTPKMRILKEDGTFTKTFKEDVQASEEVFKIQGTTREEVEEERALKRAANKRTDDKGKVKAVLSVMSEDALEKELERRKALRKKDKKENTPKVVDGEDYDAWTVGELKGALDDLGVEHKRGERKAQLIRKIKKATEEPDL